MGGDGCGWGCDVWLSYEEGGISDIRGMRGIRCIRGIRGIRGILILILILTLCTSLTMHRSPSVSPFRSVGMCCLSRLYRPTP